MSKNATALGSLATTTGSFTTLTATFKIGNKLHTFVGSFTPPMEPFAADKVTLTYATGDDLTGSPAFSGEIGIMNASLLFSTKVSISGPLNSNYKSKITIYGTGSWSVAPA